MLTEDDLETPADRGWFGMGESDSLLIDVAAGEDGPVFLVVEKAE